MLPRRLLSFLLLLRLFVLLVVPRAAFQITGLAHLVELRCLFLQQNLIRSIRNLETLSRLRTLDLSNNKLSGVEGLSELRELATLNLSKNDIADAGGLEELTTLPSLCTLDLSDNLLVESLPVYDVVIRCPAVTCLYLKGNKLVRNTRFYRKTTLSALPQLSYLDDAPVFDIERRAVAAWAEGGREAEMKVRQEIRAEEGETSRRQTRRFFEWQREVRERRCMALEDEREETATLRPFVHYRTMTKEDLDHADSLKRELLEAESAVHIGSLRTAPKPPRKSVA